MYTLDLYLRQKRRRRGDRAALSAKVWEEITAQMRATKPVLACVCLAVTAHAGILVIRSQQGLRMADATALTVNGKDKALSLGDRPALGGPASKLAAAHLAGILLKDGEAGVLLEYQAGTLDYLLPQGLPKGSPGDPAGMWKASRIAYKQAANDKTGTEVPISDFVAFLPASEDLTALCMDTRALELLGGKGKGFPTQVELMAATVKAYPADPAFAPLEKYVESAMRSRYDAFEDGSGGVDLLNEGLKFSSLSQAVYPNSFEQDKLRKLLTNRKAWLDRKIAIQNAFAAAGRWDTFLLGDRDLERYQQWFPDMAKAHTQALEGSLQLHAKIGGTLSSDGDYGGAYREFRLAGLRKPSDSALHEQALQAWTEYSRRIAMDLQSKRSKLGAGPQSAVERDLYFAEQNKQARKLDDALKNVEDAEAVMKSSLPAGTVSNATLKVWYTKADILAAEDRITEALAALEAYDLNAVDEERAQADKLRNQLLFNLASTLKGMKTRMQSAWSDGNFAAVQQLSAQGLRMKADDTDLLYYAGLAAVARRDPKQGRDLLTRYLDISNTLDANAEQRAQVSRLLPAIAASSRAAQGEANWLSGERLPKGVFYSPLSLAFQPHIDHIEASNKLHVQFEWERERLKSVVPMFEKGDHVTAEVKFQFAYENAVPQVVSAADGSDIPPAIPADPDEAYKRASVLVANNPLVDPLFIQRVTGKNLALGIAGNRFFNPFVWEKLYYFRLTYDDQGRVSHAQELASPKGAPGEQALDFEWSGMQLTAVRGYLGKAKNYERTMQYQDGLLVSEEVQGAGKASKIKYVYAANRLVSAEAATDPTLDNRNRKVTFVANSPSTLVK
jgi:hypothetical protein